MPVTLRTTILLLGVVAAGVVAYLPWREVAAEREALLALRTDVRTLVLAAEEFRIRNGAYPTSMEALGAQQGTVLSPGVVICSFVGVPAAQGGPALFVVLGHEAGTRLMGTAHPAWGGRVAEMERDEPGC